MRDALLIPKPRLRGRIHQVAFFVSVPAGGALVLLARGAAATSVATIYVVSLSAVFGSSAAYHRGAWSEQALRWMKRLDHSMIFVLIAASYTPVAALVLGGPWEVVLLSVAWAGAVVGDPTGSPFRAPSCTWCSDGSPSSRSRSCCAR